MVVLFLIHGLSLTLHVYEFCFVVVFFCMDLHSLRNKLIHYQKSTTFCSREHVLCGFMQELNDMLDGVKFFKMTGTSARRRERVNYKLLNELCSVFFFFYFAVLHNKAEDLQHTFFHL